MTPFTPTRRQTLTAIAAAGGAAAMAGCEEALSRIARQLGQDVPETVSVNSGGTIDAAHHMLNRAAYGPWPGDVEHLRSIGIEAWIDEQLHPDAIDDAACNLRARRFETLHHKPGTCFEYEKSVLREEMSRHTLLRAVYSKRQLFEVMVSFWTDHLNVNIEKGDCIYLKPSDDREVVRKHALGKFRDLIRASATSPAMLVYLDGNQNVRRSDADVPNENYARELMELHTLGVHGGYTQRDVYEAARALTGWRVRDRFRRGTVYFDASLHDNGTKTILGRTIESGQGERDVDQLVDIVCEHPSTARYVATKLVRRFVADDPPTRLVDEVAQVFTDSDGDIKTLVRTILLSEEFKSSAGQKLKSPFRFVASGLRSVGADTHAHGPLIEYLTRMGQGVFQHPTPDGYPDEATAWVGTLLWRWNFAFNLVADEVPTVTAPVDQLLKSIRSASSTDAQTLFAYFCGRRPDDVESSALSDASTAIGAGDDLRPLVGVILASPAFQRC